MYVCSTYKTYLLKHSYRVVYITHFLVNNQACWWISTCKGVSLVPVRVLSANTKIQNQKLVKCKQLNSNFSWPSWICKSAAHKRDFM